MSTKKEIYNSLYDSSYQKIIYNDKFIKKYSIENVINFTDDNFDDLFENIIDCFDFHCKISNLDKNGEYKNSTLCEKLRNKCMTFYDDVDDDSYHKGSNLLILYKNIYYNHGKYFGYFLEIMFFELYESKHFTYLLNLSKIGNYEYLNDLFMLFEIIDAYSLEGEGGKDYNDINKDTDYLEVLIPENYYPKYGDIEPLELFIKHKNIDITMKLGEGKIYEYILNFSQSNGVEPEETMYNTLNLVKSIYELEDDKEYLFNYILPDIDEYNEIKDFKTHEILCVSILISIVVNVCHKYSKCKYLDDKYDWYNIVPVDFENINANKKYQNLCMSVIKHFVNNDVLNCHNNKNKK